MAKLQIVAAATLLVAIATVNGQSGVPVPCGPTWIVSHNTNQLRGVPTNDAALTDCQATCNRNGSCSGVDWNPSMRVGQRCWMSGHWSGGRNHGTVPGITHYDIVRNGQCGGCHSWSPFIDSNDLNGRPTYSATLLECQAACVSDNNCTGIDWNPTATVGQRCWKSGYWSGGRNRGTVPRVTHYDLARNAKCGDDQRDVWTGCRPSWSGTSNTNVERGRSNSAGSITDCQMACYSETRCTGVDWHSTGQAGQQCWLSGPWSGSWNRGNASGITHYDIRRNAYCGASAKRCPNDIVFVLDQSGSIGSSNFDLMKSFLSQLVTNFDIDSGNTRVGLVSYSTIVGTSFALNKYTSVAAVQSAISSLSYAGGSTNTAAALEYVRTTSLTAAEGDRSNVPNVVVVLTDGKSNNESATAMEAEKLKNMVSGGTRTKVVALGIGSRVSEMELNKVASAPTDRNVILVQDFSTLTSVEGQLRNASCSAQPMPCPTDIVFVLDESGSIGSSNFERMKTFISQLVGRMDIDSGNTRVGVVTYSSNVDRSFDLNKHKSVSSLQAYISAISYSRGGTNTAAALAYVRTNMLTAAAGDRDDVPNVVVVVTDGQSKDPAATRGEARLLQAMMSGGRQTKVVALGIGSGVDQTELRDIATSPQDRNVILVQDFNSLDSVDDQLRNASCNPQPVSCPTDIVIVMDESGSIGSSNFDLMKSFLSQLVAKFDIDSGSTRVGLVTYSSIVGSSFNLNTHTTLASLQAAIASLTYSQGSTNTAAALAFVRTTMLTAAEGDRSNAPNVVVVLTDGRSNDEAATATEAKLLQGVASGGTRTKVVALGIGSGVDQTELENIASSPDDRNVILVQNFTRLTDVEEQLRRASCSPQPIECPTDIVFVVDESGSIGSTNFDLVKSFLIHLVGRLDIDSGNTRVGLVTFSTDVGFSFHLDAYKTVYEVQKAIMALGYPGGKTNTGAALAFVRAYMLNPMKGDRRDVPNVVVVLTDGRSQDDSATRNEARLLRSITTRGLRPTQTKVVSLGIGSKVDQKELEDIASAPYGTNVIRVQDFSSLPMVEDQLRNTSCRPQPPKCPTDIVFVVDESGSIGASNFELMKAFLFQLVGWLDVDSGNTRVGLITYSTSVGTSFNLVTYTTVTSLQAAISSLSYSQGSTNTGDALEYVRTTLLTAAAGDRSNVPNIVVVLTDGKSTSETATLREAANLRNVMSGGTRTKIVALGITSGVSVSELNAMASSPSRKNVILIDDFANLLDVRDQLRDTSCRPVVVQYPVDLIFVLDASGSIGSAVFSQMQTFVSRVVEFFDIDSGVVRVGACSFSTTVTDSFSLSAHSTVATVKSAILSLSYSGGSGNTAAALSFVRKSMLTVAAGARANAPSIVVVVTDGPSTNPLSTMAQANLLKTMAMAGTMTRIVTIGVGIDVSWMSLKYLGSAPHDYNFVSLPNFDTVSQDTAEVVLVDNIFTRCMADVIIVLDTSISVGWSNPDQIKTFLWSLTGQMLGQLGMDTGTTRVGLVTYSTKVQRLVSLTTYSTTGSVQTAIWSARYARSATNTGKALEYVREEMLTPLAGARYGVPAVVIILTDGLSSDPHETMEEAKDLKKREMTRVVAVGVGNDVGMHELYGIASYPQHMNVITAADFTNATATIVADHVSRAVCAPPMPKYDKEKMDEMDMYDYPKGWVYMKQTQKYYRAVFELMDWRKADMRCREFGSESRLVDINDDVENGAIKKFVGSFDAHYDTLSVASHLYIGGLRPTFSAKINNERLARICEGPRVLGTPGYQGYWTSGQRFNATSCDISSHWVWKTYPNMYKNVTYTDWHSNEPNCAGGSETCLQLTTTYYLDQRWADINCDWVLCPLCELDI